VRSYEITSDGISSFLSNLTCGNGKLNHYRAITVFVHWLMREGYLKDNPLTMVDKPKPGKRLLPSVTDKEVAVLLNAARNLRDKLECTPMIGQIGLGESGGVSRCSPD
jgi:site-specific recombinase XerD